MRRKDKEIKDRAKIEEIIKKAEICRIALSDKDSPYVFPVCFGYKNNCLYFHSAREGKKIEILKRNNTVCFEIDTDVELVETEKGCGWKMKYLSVIGFGKAEFVEGLGKKRKALSIILAHYSDKSYDFPEKKVNDVAIVKIDIENMTGKKSGY